MRPTDLTPRIEFANALRGIACLFVAVGHLCAGFWSYQPVVHWLTGLPELSMPLPFFAGPLVASPIALGAFGVGLFFLTSGFVIPYSLVSYSRPGFLVGRALRIHPTYAACFLYVLLWTLLGVGVTDNTAGVKVKDALVHFVPPLQLILTTKPMDGVIWSLEVELVFYLICAALAKPIRRGSWLVLAGPAFAFVVWLFLQTGICFWGKDDPNLLIKLKMWAVFAPFPAFMFCGMALNFRQRELFSRREAALAITLCLAAFFPSRFIGNNSMLDPASYSSALAVFVFAMWAQKRFKPGRILRKLADISYPLYVVHSVPGYVIMHGMIVHGWNPTVSVLAAFAAAFTSASLIHRWIERPSHRLGQKLARALSRPRASENAAVLAPATALAPGN